MLKSNEKKDGVLDFSLAWMRLARSSGISSIMFHSLIKTFATPQNVIARLPELIERNKFPNYQPKNITLASLEDVEIELEKTRRYGAKVILSCDQEYPLLLREIPDHPPAITVRGDTNLLKMHKIGIVGARNASANGLFISSSFAKEISAKGYVIISGLARGIDTAAHAKVMSDFGSIGVIAGGIDTIYPPENKKLYDAMYCKGLVVSEYRFGTPPMAKYFPQRNRIIAGMCSGLVVVEAAKRSGALITARMALTYDRDIFAVPGSILDPNAQGTNQLIKNGAALVQNVDDIFDAALLRNQQYREELAEKEGYHYEGEAFLDRAEMMDKVVEDRELECPTKGEIEEYGKMLEEKITYAPISTNILRESVPEIPDRIFNYLLIEMEIAGKIERREDDMISFLHPNFSL